MGSALAPFGEDIFLIATHSVVTVACQVLARLVIATGKQDPSSLSATSANAQGLLFWACCSITCCSSNGT